MQFKYSTLQQTILKYYFSLISDLKFRAKIVIFETFFGFQKLAKTRKKFRKIEKKKKKFQNGDFLKT